MSLCPSPRCSRDPPGPAELVPAPPAWQHRGDPFLRREDGAAPRSARRTEGPSFRELIHLSRGARVNLKGYSPVSAKGSRREQSASERRSRRGEETRANEALSQGASGTSWLCPGFGSSRRCDSTPGRGTSCCPTARPDGLRDPPGAGHLLPGGTYCGSAPAASEQGAVGAEQSKGRMAGHRGDSGQGHSLSDAVAGSSPPTHSRGAPQQHRSSPGCWWQLCPR